MRKLIFVVFIATGMALALLFGIKEDWGTRFVLMFFGAIAGTAVGGAVTEIRKQRRSRPYAEDDALRGLGNTSEDLMDNYWRDNGHPQFMKPPLPDSKQFGGTGGMAD